MKTQFGCGVGRMDNFRPRFLDNLALAMSVYRKAHVDMDARGLILFPSPPPVKLKALL